MCKETKAGVRIPEGSRLSRQYSSQQSHWWISAPTSIPSVYGRASTRLQGQSFLQRCHEDPCSQNTGRRGRILTPRYGQKLTATTPRATELPPSAPRIPRFLLPEMYCVIVPKSVPPAPARPGPFSPGRHVLRARRPLRRVSFLTKCLLSSPPDPPRRHPCMRGGLTFLWNCYEIPATGIRCDVVGACF